ncbi:MULTISPECIES: NAD(P)/FAD-dependent oxidoreductase [unclassified Nocardia]|uniref:NAD(P)/FAD-dependent oxidoreductase n=1 Tax=unclassified Nocardia TaxID=2637762 RepID=UPI0033A9819A
MSEKIQVVVVGGGYAGVMAANRLTQRDDVAVTVVNPRARFVERIRLHQLVGGTDDAVAEYGDVLATGVRLVVDTVTGIDAAGRTVALGGGDTIGYDYLIYAVGSGSAAPRVPGAGEFAYPIASLEEAQRLGPVLDAAAATAAVTVVGAGPTGIETAAELAERGRAVTLVCGDVLGPYLHARGRRAVTKRLTALGVTILDGPDAKVVEVTAESVRLSGGHVLRSAVTIWTAGFGVPDLATRSGLRTDAVGRLLTDETLTSIDDDRIVAAGDSAAPSNLPFRMSCQAAGPLGAHAADTILRRIADERPDPIDLGFAGQCISLGRHAGVFQFADKDDAAKWFHLGGRPGAKVKEFVCGHTIKQLATEARKPGTHTWAKGDQRAQLLRDRADTDPAGAAATAGHR